MLNGESVGTIYVDIKANDKFTTDFTKFMRDAENSAVSFERKQSQILNSIAEKWKKGRSFLDPASQGLFENPPRIYEFWKRYLEVMIDDVEQKTEALTRLLEGSKGKPSIPEVNLRALEDLLKYEKLLKAEQVKLAKDYYSRLKFEDDNYYTWRVQQINQEADLFKKRLGDKFDTDKFITSEMKKLGEEFEKFQTSKTTTKATEPPKENWMIPTSAQNPTGSDIWDSHNINTTPSPFMPNSEGLLRTVPVPPKPPLPSWNTEQLFKDFIESSRTGQIAFEAFSDSVAKSLAFIHIRLASDASSMEKIWGNMINSMIDQVTQLIAKWAVLNFVGAVFGFGGINLGSFLGLSDSESGKGGKNLGSFVGMKLAAGGDFIVPQGYANDSYPMLVQSGERVRVTPTGKVGEEAQLLARLINAVEANTLDRRMIGNRPVIIQPRISISNRDLTKEVSKTNKTITKEGWKSD